MENNASHMTGRGSRIIFIGNGQHRVATQMDERRRVRATGGRDKSPTTTAGCSIGGHSCVVLVFRNEDAQNLVKPRIMEGDRTTQPSTLHRDAATRNAAPTETRVTKKKRGNETCRSKEKCGRSYGLKSG